MAKGRDNRSREEKKKKKKSKKDRLAATDAVTFQHHAVVTSAGADRAGETPS